MRIIPFALLALTFVPSPASAAQKETETVDRTIAFSRGGTLKLNNFSGEVRVTGTSGNDVVIHAVRNAPRDRLDNVKLDIEVTGSTIEIEANRRTGGWDRQNDNIVETRFEIQVPAATMLDLHTFSGDLIAHGTTSDVR